MSDRVLERVEKVSLSEVLRKSQLLWREVIFELPPEYPGESSAQTLGSGGSSEYKVLGMERSLVCSEDKGKARVSVT